MLALAGCAGSTHAVSSRPDAHAAAATLTVHIGVFGGPARPDGSMAVSDAPAVGRQVTVRAADGRRTVATTDALGTATLRLAAGRYSVSSAFCGLGPRTVALTGSRPVQVQFACPVP